MKIHVLTYNTHLFGNSCFSYIPKSTLNDDERCDEILSFLENNDYDIIGLQEVFNYKYIKNKQKNIK